MYGNNTSMYFENKKKSVYKLKFKRYLIWIKNEYLKRNNWTSF